MVTQDETEHDGESLIPLRAGSLSMLFDAEQAILRYVAFTRSDGTEVEVIRGVYAALRDRDWDSIVPTIHNVQLNQHADRHELTWDATCIRKEIHFRWQGKITVDESNSVAFRFSGEALSTFERNRIGICLLHPIVDCVGKRCRITHSGGQITESSFPRAISPHQPFLDIRSIAYELEPGVDAVITFEGDVFETEDQRNWTDASFKTYSTPLALPFPVEVKQGARFEQSIILRLIGDRLEEKSVKGPFQEKSNAAQPGSPAKITVDWNQQRELPPIGLSMTSDEFVRGGVTDFAVDQLSSLRIDHLRVDLQSNDAQRKKRLDTAIELAERIGAKLEVALHLSGFSGKTPNDGLWRQLLDDLNPLKNLASRFLIFDTDSPATPAELVRSSKDALSQLRSSASIAVGTDAYFAELNRNRPPTDETDLVCYSINPQVHAFDDLSLCETLVAQKATVDSAHEFFDCPVSVTPITLLPRFNPNATSTAEGELATSSDVDPRQNTGFNAAWTVGSVSQLATHPSIASLTYFEAFGPRGVMSAEGTLYPVANVFREIGRHRVINTTESSHPLAVAALALSNTQERSLLLANYSSASREISVHADGTETPFTVGAQSTRVVSDKELR